MRQPKRIGKIKTIGSLKRASSNARKPPIKGTAARSSSIENHAYDPETGHLTVTFRGGRQYRYEGVDQKIADGLDSAKSKGGYLHRSIVGKFDASKI